MLGPALAVAAASLAMGGPVVTPADVPAACPDARDGVATAVACDPERRARGYELRIGHRRARGRGVRGDKSFNSVEPLLPGETLVLTWHHPSARAVMWVTAMTSDRERRTVVLALRKEPTRVAVTARADGSLGVRLPDREWLVPPQSPLAPVTWQVRSAREAAGRILGAFDRMDRSVVARQTLCAALHPDVFSVFEFSDDDRERYGCLGVMAYLYRATDSGDDPRPTSTTRHGFAVAVHGDRAIVSTPLVHRYEDHRRPVAVRARVLLVRDGVGIWRLATIDALLPYVALHHRRPDTTAQLERTYRYYAAAGPKLARLWDQRQARRRIATVPLAASAPCTAPMTPPLYPPIISVDGWGPARNQAAHHDVAILGFGEVGGCVILRTAAPLPPRFVVGVTYDTGQAVTVTVADDTMLVEDISSEDEAPRALTGGAAYVAGDTVVIRLPVVGSGNVHLDLKDSPTGIAYSDSAYVDHEPLR